MVPATAHAETEGRGHSADGEVQRSARGSGGPGGL